MVETKKGEETLEYFVEEMYLFHEYLSAMSTKYSESEDYGVNMLNLAEKLTDFHDKYKDKYNQKQLSFQFVKQTYKNQAMMKMYNSFRKVKDQLL